MTSLHTQFPRLHDEPASGTGWPARPTHGLARSSLFINGTAYQVRPLSPDALTAIKAFRLRKFDGTEYDIAQTVHGMTCDCPDFTFKREGIDPEGFCLRPGEIVRYGRSPGILALVIAWPLCWT